MNKYVVSEMVDAGFPIQLDEPVWMDHEGNSCPEHDACGCKVHNKIKHPELCFVVMALAGIFDER